MKQGFITTAILGAICCAPALHCQKPSVATRFGKLEVNQKGVLEFGGIPLEPGIQANARLDLGTPFRFGGYDVVLVTDEGGTACPFQYYFVTLRRSGVRATKPFGTCNEVMSLRRNGDSITLQMRGYRGPFEPPAERRRAARQNHTFVFRDGVVRETGTVVVPGSKN
jgi:hypothetical protein